jgi:hypothetical protein
VSLLGKKYLILVLGSSFDLVADPVVVFLGSWLMWIQVHRLVVNRDPKFTNFVEVGGSSSCFCSQVSLGYRFGNLGRVTSVKSSILRTQLLMVMTSWY